MSCVYQAEQLSIPCIIEIANDIRNKTISVTTIRKTIKQIDSGLAAFGKPETDIGTLSTDLETLANQLEASVTDNAAQAPVWLPILIAILKLLLQ